MYEMAFRLPHSAYGRAGMSTSSTSPDRLVLASGSRRGHALRGPVDDRSDGLRLRDVHSVIALDLRDRRARWARKSGATQLQGLTHYK